MVRRPVGHWYWVHAPGPARPPEPVVGRRSSQQFRHERLKNQRPCGDEGALTTPRAPDKDGQALQGALLAHSPPSPLSAAHALDTPHPHPQNNNDRAFFSNAERKAAAYGRHSSSMLGGHNTGANFKEWGWGTETRTLDSDSMKDIDACSLSLQTCVEPLVTPSGVLYDKEVCAGHAQHLSRVARGTDPSPQRCRARVAPSVPFIQRTS